MRTHRSTLLPILIILLLLNFIFVLYNSNTKITRRNLESDRMEFREYIDEVKK